MHSSIMKGNGGKNALNLNVIRERNRTLLKSLLNINLNDKELKEIKSEILF